MGKLTATQVKQAKPGQKLLKLADGGGMYLQIHPNGARYWRYDYRYAGTRALFVHRSLPKGLGPI